MFILLSHTLLCNRKTKFSGVLSPGLLIVLTTSLIRGHTHLQHTGSFAGLHKRLTGLIFNRGLPYMTRSLILLLPSTTIP